MRNLSMPLSSTWGDDDKKKGKKDKTISLNEGSAPQRQFNFSQSESKSKGLKANPFLTDQEAKSKRASLAKDLRTGKISKADYDKGMSMARTKNDIKNVQKNAGGSGKATSNFRGSECSMTAETRSRSCSKPGKGF